MAYHYGVPPQPYHKFYDSGEEFKTVTTEIAGRGKRPKSYNSGDERYPTLPYRDSYIPSLSSESISISQGTKQSPKPSIHHRSTDHSDSFRKAPSVDGNLCFKHDTKLHTLTEDRSSDERKMMLRIMAQHEPNSTKLLSQTPAIAADRLGIREARMKRSGHARSNFAPARHVRVSDSSRIRTGDIYADTQYDTVDVRPNFQVLDKAAQEQMLQQAGFNAKPSWAHWETAKTSRPMPSDRSSLASPRSRYRPPGERLKKSPVPDIDTGASVFLEQEIDPALVQYLSDASEESSDDRWERHHSQASAYIRKARATSRLN